MLKLGRSFLILDRAWKHSDQNLSLRVTADLKAQVEAIARAEHRTVSQICEILLSYAVRRYRDEDSILAILKK
jgi:hypothetical protein